MPREIRGFITLRYLTTKSTKILSRTRLLFSWSCNNKVHVHWNTHGIFSSKDIASRFHFFFHQVSICLRNRQFRSFLSNQNSLVCISQNGNANPLLTTTEIYWKPKNIELVPKYIWNTPHPHPDFIEINFKYMYIKYNLY